MATQNRMSAKMQPCLTPEVVEILSDPDACTGILIYQMEYDVRHAFAAKCFPEGSVVDIVESRLNVQGPDFQNFLRS